MFEDYMRIEFGDFFSYLPSPVPGDSDLWPGELPFTAFGQFGRGRLDLRVFDQARYWVDMHGAPHEISEMPKEYVENVITMLSDRSTEFYSVSMLRCALQILGDVVLGRTNGDLLANEVGGAELGELDHDVWLEATPLMRTLRRRSRSMI